MVSFTELHWCFMNKKLLMKRKLSYRLFAEFDDIKRKSIFIDYNDYMLINVDLTQFPREMARFFERLHLKLKNSIGNTR